MHLRTLTLTALSAAAVLAAGSLPTTASGTPRPTSAQEGAVDAAGLLAKVSSCAQISHGKYRTDANTRAEIPVCGLKGAVFWKADMDIDCDGRRTAKCNERTDPWFHPDTAFHQSDGRPLRSDTLPYVVVPGASALWKPAASGIRGGGVVAVIHDGKVRYAVVGDTGPSQIIGEASYAAAKSLGIDPDPARGGTAAEVTYILFKDSRVSPIESHRQAVALGKRLTKRFLLEN
ncbi:glycoside hydrolase family 75 protein [Streptomyces resistomycificus]|uniref:Sugar hydrolase n=1 Tax=Streptomyces resistomycificus TaxID=67356 RepID=A0A0L8LXZ6_9ACTN|nr:glycoside hydrolase family 75 protein [Streptomyces resistomycificus]KOG42964.1 hypothetical protein ADK37_03225 [Streptomyces resistomycificus]KUO01407.1 hypothetical protein AQJ84_02855 [Streptomyces resistomycificus]